MKLSFYSLGLDTHGDNMFVWTLLKKQELFLPLLIIIV